jgi:hypothetical protein
LGRASDVEFWKSVEARRRAAEDAIRIRQPKGKKPAKRDDDGVSRAEYEERREQFLQWAAIGIDDEPYRQRYEARARRRAINAAPLGIYRDLEEAERVGDRHFAFIIRKVLGHMRTVDMGTYRSPPAYASDIHRLEARGAKRKGFRRKKTGKVPQVSLGPNKSDHDGGNARALGALQPGSNPIARETWGLTGFKTHMTLPFFDKELGEVVQLDVCPEDRKLMERIFAKLPERKRGRPRKRKVEK